MKFSFMLSSHTAFWSSAFHDVCFLTPILWGHLSLFLAKKAQSSFSRHILFHTRDTGCVVTCLHLPSQDPWGGSLIISHIRRWISRLAVKQGNTVPLMLYTSSFCQLCGTYALCRNYLTMPLWRSSHDPIHKWTNRTVSNKTLLTEAGDTVGVEELVSNPSVFFPILYYSILFSFLVDRLDTNSKSFAFKFSSLCYTLWLCNLTFTPVFFVFLTSLSKVISPRENTG